MPSSGKMRILKINIQQELWKVDTIKKLINLHDNYDNLLSIQVELLLLLDHVL